METILEGAWKQIGATENSEAIDCNDEIILEIIGSTFTVKCNGVPDIEGTFEVDSGRDPQSIDWRDLVGIDSGKVFKSF